MKELTDLFIRLPRRLPGCLLVRLILRYQTYPCNVSDFRPKRPARQQQTEAWFLVQRYTLPNLLTRFFRRTDCLNKRGFDGVRHQRRQLRRRRPVDKIKSSYEAVVVVRWYRSSGSANKRRVNLTRFRLLMYIIYEFGKL